MSKEKKKHFYNTRSKSKKISNDSYKNNESSSDEDCDSEEIDEDFNHDKYLKLIQEMFPSK